MAWKLMVNFRFFALIAAMILYAAMSSPTPDHPGWVEGVVGVLLLVAAIPGAVIMVRDAAQMKNMWQGAGAALMIYGFSVPLVMGGAQAYAPYLMVRDILPFLFLGLPLFACDIFIGDPKRFKIFSGVFVFVGTLMAVRSLMGGAAVLGLHFERFQELFYFANAPGVLVAALAYVSLFVRLFMQKIQLRSVAGMALFLVLMAVPLAAMTGSLQRASLGYLAVYICVLCLYALYRRPLRGALLIAVFGVLTLSFGAAVMDVIGALLEKTQLHGFNRRAEEFFAVWDAVRTSPLTAAFGLGWGAEFSSPAVGGLQVGFTHNFFSSLLLKTGVLGMGLGALYMAGMVRVLIALLRVHFFAALLFIGPFLIDVFLYASFKSLDFGLLLLAIPACLLSGVSPLLARKMQL